MVEEIIIGIDWRWGFGLQAIDDGRWTMDDARDVGQSNIKDDWSHGKSVFGLLNGLQ